MKEKPTKILLVVTAFSNLYISGYVNRFTAFWKYIVQYEDGSRFHFLTNRTLWDKVYARKNNNNETIIKLRPSLVRFSIRIFYPLYIIYLYKKHKCTSVHLGPNIIDWLFTIRLLNFFGIPHCLTFASNSVEMASYNSPALKARLTKVLNEAYAIDILNPTHHLHSFKSRKFVSPSSFPYILYDSQIDLESYPEAKQNDIVFCGSFIDQKNPILALEIFETFLSQNPGSDARILFFGKGPLQPQMDIMANRINADAKREAVVFENYTNLFTVLAASKIFLSLQDYDNYPSQSIMEAMLFQNRIISFNNGDTSKLVTEANENILLPDKQIQPLVNALSDMLRRNRPCRQNRQFILEHFTAKRFFDYIESIHEQIKNKD